MTSAVSSRSALDGVALLLEGLAGLENRAVFHGGRDDVLADVAVLVQGKADGPVIALRPAGGEDELFTLAAERGGNRLARRGDSVARLPSDGVLRAGVAPARNQRIVNGVRHLFGNGGGGRVIEIDHIGKILSLVLSECSNDYTI